MSQRFAGTLAAMPSPDPVARLLDAVAWRERLARAARAGGWALLLALVLVTVLLVLHRLLGGWGWRESWWWLLLPAIATAVAAIAAGRGIDRRQAAALTDRASGSKDLFITALAVSTVPGGFATVVVDQAAARAATMNPRNLRPWQPRLGAAWCGGAALLLAAAWWLTPEADPFGRRVEALAQAERRERLEASQQALAARKEAVQTRRDEAAQPHSSEVQQGLDALVAQLQAARPERKDANEAGLREVQHALATLHGERQEQRLADELARRSQGQQLGDSDLRRLAEAVKKGDAQPLAQALEELQQMREQLGGADLQSPEGQRALRKLRRQIEDLHTLAQQELGDPALAEDLKEALAQLDLARFPDLTPDALDAVQESLQQAGLDGEQLAQAMRDLRALEQAQQLAQQARERNQQGKLGEGECQACAGQGMAAYAELYAQLTAEGRTAGEGQGEGGGMQGPGQGQGGEAPEDDSQATGFTPEEVKTQLHAGRMLMEWETKGLGEKGEAVQGWRQNVQAVQQDLSEAILHEQVPAGYHDQIRSYFDSLAGQGPAKE